MESSTHAYDALGVDVSTSQYVVQGTDRNFWILHRWAPSLLRRSFDSWTTRSEEKEGTFIDARPPGESQRYRVWDWGDYPALVVRTRRGHSGEPWRSRNYG